VGGVTPLLVTALLSALSWRAVFVLFGSIGFVWAVAWHRWFRDDPSMHASVGEAELALIQEGRVVEAAHSAQSTPWRRLLANRSVVCLCLMYFTQTYGFVLYVTWLPTYLKSDRGFSALALGIFSGLPLTLSVLADLFGGITTDRLSRRWGLRVGRVAVGAGSLFAAGVFMISGAFTSKPVLAAVLIALAGAASNFLLGAAWGTCIDMGGRHSGVISAAMNTSGQIGGVLSPIVLAYLVQRLGSWSPALYLTGALYLGGALCWLWVDPRRQLNEFD
jgi:MFS transporter, ACS family, glucarate transporter